MPTVSELISGNISNAMTNIQIWNGILQNVKAYGAKGDRENDDTTAIQQTVDAAIASGSLVVFFPPGVYRVTGNLQRLDQVVLVGNNARFEGIDADIIQLGVGPRSYNAPYPLSFTTYDTSNWVVHPDVYKVYENYGQNGEETPAKHNGYTYWMVLTPYPEGSQFYENPSIFVSNDAVNWSIPPGVTNPVIPAPDARGQVIPYQRPTGDGPFLSDPDWLFDPTDLKFKMIYRYADSSIAGGPNIFYYIESSNSGVSWSSPFEIFRENRTALSPAVVRKGPGDFEMYYVVGVNEQYWIEKRTSSDMKIWSAPSKINLPEFPNGGRPWHVDAISTANGIELLVNTNPANTFKPEALYILSSTDGINFQIENGGVPIVKLSDVGWDDYYIYRGTFVKRNSDGFYQIWYSARNIEGRYNIGYLEGYLNTGFTSKGTEKGVVPIQRFFFNYNDLWEGYEGNIFFNPDTTLEIYGAVNAGLNKRVTTVREVLKVDDFIHIEKTGATLENTPRIRFSNYGVSSAAIGADSQNLRLRVCADSDATILADLIVRTHYISDGTWNGGHLVMGNYHLWVDSTGKLRIKNGAPISDTDGTVVGTQT